MFQTTEHSNRKLLINLCAINNELKRARHLTLSSISPLQASSAMNLYSPVWTIRGEALKLTQSPGTTAHLICGELNMDICFWTLLTDSPTIWQIYSSLSTVTAGICRVLIRAVDCCEARLRELESCGEGIADWGDAS